jgi:hypothetical protein
VADQRNAALEALQAAALQLIAAARQVLDAAEQAVRDPEVVGQVAGSLTAIAKAAVDVFTPARPGGVADGTDGSPADRGDGDGGVEHIDVG